MSSDISINTCEELIFPCRGSIWVISEDGRSRTLQTCGNLLRIEVAYTNGVPATVSCIIPEGAREHCCYIHRVHRRRRGGWGNTYQTITCSRIDNFTFIHCAVCKSRVKREKFTRPII